MNPVEIEEAVSALVEQPFDAVEFPFTFLKAFDNKDTTIRKLRAGASNSSDVGGVLQRNHIHIAVAPVGEVSTALAALRSSPATAKAKARFILATDGVDFEAEHLANGETVACAYGDFPDHFGFFLPLAGINTVQQITDNAFDIRATSRLNRLYIELLRDNPDWATSDRRHDMNHFMARLIFCFFAEDTDIFHPSHKFTAIVEKMSARDSSNTHEVIGEIFRAMNTPTRHNGQLDTRYRDAAGIKSWATVFPYVNGGLFSGSADVPHFSKIARSYLLHIGNLDWTKINPDIFGSMIQAVADDEERGALGMHYTSVPNILKVLNPLFLDDLRAKLDDAGTNKRKLQNLRQRLSRIRVFDPACGSGNFLVIAYKQMREIERRIQVRLADGADTVEALLDVFNYPGDRSVIPLTNFRGIELRDFPAEIARLALIIAEFQCDVLYRGQKLALAEFLPLDAENWITCGNALRLDWLKVCPPEGIGARLVSEDLLETPLDQTQIDFENEGGETYICGNPPYKGSQDQTPGQKADLAVAFAQRIKSTKSADYVTGWFILARDYIAKSGAASAFVATNSINQGRQVSLVWPAILSDDIEIRFARPSFQWSNLASKKAVVTVSVVGLGRKSTKPKQVFTADTVMQARHIGSYLVPDQSVIVAPSSRPLSPLSEMTYGSMPNDNGGLILTQEEARTLIESNLQAARYVKRLLGSNGAIHGQWRYCLWISTSDLDDAQAIEPIRRRIEVVKAHREQSSRPTTQALSKTPHLFGEIRHSDERALVVPCHSAEDRPYLPFELVDADTVVDNSAIRLSAPPMPEIAIYASRLHLVWIATVCGQIETRFRYSNTLGWNTFPLPVEGLTEKNRFDLTRCAEDILLARERHFPKTIADLYDPDNMPADLREAHERNDEVLERIYVGRRFRNDTERLEKLFDLYTKMTATPSPSRRTQARKRVAS